MSQSKLKKKTESKKVVKTARITRENARIRERPKYKSFRLHKRVKHPDKALPGSYKLMKKALSLMWANKLPLIFFTLVYGVMFLLFVRGIFNPININDIRAEVEVSLGEGSGTSFETNRLVFGQLAGTIASGLSGEQSVYQVMLLVIGSLALIWLYRQQQAGNTVTVRMAFYRGMYPLIPFLLIVYLILLQLLPGVIGNFLYSTVVAGGIAVNGLEQFIWLTLYLSLLLLSFYLVSSSLIALMIVTLPEMTPMMALRRARELARFRRFSLFRKVIGLMIIVALIFIAIVFPSLYIAAWLAQVLFLLLSILALPFVIAYLFILYRELL